MAIIKNQSTDLRTIESINIENSEKVSKQTKKELKETENTNNKNVQESKPKLVIKIPKPFALGYWIIDLSKLLRNLLEGLAAAVVALILSKIAQLLTNFIQSKIDDGISANSISQSDIDKALNNMDINSLIKESQNEYNKQQKINLNSSVDTSAISDDGTITDVYNKSNVNKKNISNKDRYTINKRNRKDVLESEKVKERNSSNNRNIKLVKNPNYGVYLD